MAWEGFRRIGHGGASALAPANTLASFEAAAAAGIDIAEFDVRE
jgi:glycerophosphoryl diester phosphodiesterase